MKHLLTFLLFCLPFVVTSQRVGLVLSGGGASGFAHIGVLKALEENNIPIDYITGTSAGALVGSMYACGYSPAEIEDFVLSDLFQLMTKGDVLPRQHFFLREQEINSDVLSISFSKDSIFKKSLPTNFVRPELMDFQMMLLLGRTSASVNNNFDSLFVPFRCVASDIVAKRANVFNKVNLNEAVRASMTFPFFINPIRVNGVLYFDGGLYNNFPADVMYANFVPDYIIGSNVSYNAEPPTEDDLISQVTNMMVSYSNFSLPCEEGLIIEPNTAVRTFDFDNVKKAIEDGYQATILKMDSLKAAIEARSDPQQLAAKRQAFRASVPELVVAQVNTRTIEGNDQSYVRKSILKNAKQQSITDRRLERRYFRTYATPQIEYLYPTLKLVTDSTYSLDILVRKSKDFRLDVGGLICSRAVNTGFVQLNYQHLGRVALNTRVNSYFGKFYGSAKAAVDIHLPSYYPLSFSAYAVLNRWDYFRSFATFFEDVKPSFLVQYEKYFGVQFRQPILNNSKSTLDYRHVELEDQYYQTKEFTSKDTADITKFSGNVLSWSIEHNTLNRKQFASSGMHALFRIRYVQGRENSISGSTSSEQYDYRQTHNWLNLSGELRSFPIDFPVFKFGVHGLANFSSQSLFKNYTATILSMNSFNPLPDMYTYFLPEYRSPQFIGGGMNIIFSLSRSIDLRFDGYLYQPFTILVLNDNGSFGYSNLFKGETQVASVSGIYHSPIGPVRLTLNYFPQQELPFNLQVSYGYTLFNERATR